MLESGMANANASFNSHSSEEKRSIEKVVIPEEQKEAEKDVNEFTFDQPVEEVAAAKQSPIRHEKQ